MSQDFATRLQLELRAAAERQERRGALGRLRVELPRPSRLAIAAIAAAVLLAVVLAGGIRWSGEDTITAPRVAETFTLADNLGSIATGFGAVWATDPSKPELLRVDPETHRVTGRTPVTENPVVGAGAGAVWVVGFSDNVSDPGVLLKVDPETAAVDARTRLRTPDGEPFAAAGVQVEGGDVWVLGAAGALRIDPASADVTSFVPIEERAGDPFPQDLWITPGGLVALRREGRFERYDLRTGRLAGLLPVRLAGAKYFVPTPAGAVLATGLGRLALAEPRRGAIVWDRQMPGTTWPMLDGEALWAVVSETGGDQLYELGLRTGATRSRTRLPEFGTTSVVRVGDALWAASQNGRVMVVQTPPRKAG